MKAILEDSKGNRSSKRIFGAILITVALLCSITLFIISLLSGAPDANTAISVINMLLIAGGGLLGIGVFEKGIAKKKK